MALQTLEGEATATLHQRLHTPPPTTTGAGPDPEHRTPVVTSTTAPRTKGGATTAPTSTEEGKKQIPTHITLMMRKYSNGSVRGIGNARGQRDTEPPISDHSSISV